MKSIAIPFARHVPSREIVDPSQVERGRAANVICLDCGEPLLARKGKKNAWHFAHEDHSQCSASGESILHFVAKHRLATGIDHLLPAPDTGTLGGIRIKYGRTEVGIEGERKGEIIRRCDVTLGVEIPGLESESLFYIIVEVNVTNRKDKEYIELLKESNLIGLEVDVPADLVDSLDKLDHVLFVSSDNWRWLNRTGPFLDSNRIPRRERHSLRAPLLRPQRTRGRRRGRRR